MKKTFFLKLLPTVFSLLFCAGLWAAKPNKPLSTTDKDRLLVGEINRIRQLSDQILEKEDDAEQKVISLLQDERLSESAQKNANAGKIAVLHSLSAQSLLEYYRRFGFGIEESDYARPNRNAPVPDYNALANWRFNDFKQEILHQLESSWQIEFSEPDKSLLYGSEGLAILDSNRNTYRPGLKEILCHRAWQILYDMERHGLLQEKERIEKIDAIYNYLQEYSSNQGKSDSLQARFDLELRYLNYRYHNRLCPAKQYEERLQKTALAYENLPNAGDAWYLIACLHKDNAPFEAEKYARKAMTYKDCWGAGKSRQLLHSLLSPALNISTSSVQLPSQAIPLFVEEKNCSGFDYRIYRLNEEEAAAWQFCQNQQKFADKLNLSSRQSVCGHIDLPLEKEDLQMHNGTVALPALAPGFYLMKVQSKSIRYKGADANFEASELSSILFFQVSGTAFFCYPENERLWKGFLVDRKNGLPLKGMNVEAFFVDYDYNKKSNCLQLRYRTKTDKNGAFQIDSSAMQPDEPYTRLLLRFCGTSDTLWLERYNRLTLNKPYQETRRKVDSNLWQEVQDIFFFNNLPVYRPGDSLLIKALVVLKNNGKPVVASGFPAPLSLSLRNPEGERQGGGQFSIDENGMAHIALKIPQDAKAGTWTIQTAGHIATGFIEVENYKRASFSVELSAPASIRPADSCIVTGKALYFSGEAVRSATANYRIYASTSFYRPYPYFRRYPQHRQLIDQGTVITDENGGFSIRLLPEKFPETTKECRYYEIECDLSDRGGEIQTARLTVPVRQKPVLSAQFPEMLVSNGNQWLNRSGSVQFFLNGETNDTLWRNTKTELQFFRLSDKIENSPFAEGLRNVYPNGGKTIHYMDERELRELLPSTPYFSLQERDSMAVFTPMPQWHSSLTENGVFNLPAGMPAGCYEYRVNAYTANGDTLRLKGRFYVVTTGRMLPSEMGQDGFFITDNTDEPEFSDIHELELYAGNPSRQAIVANFQITDIEGNELRFSRTLASGCSKITLPKHSLSLQGDWAFSAFYQVENHTFTNSFVIPVSREKKEMEISCSLPDKIVSGEDIQLNFRIKNGKEGGKPMPLILSLYDASLDMFADGFSTWPTSLAREVPYPQNPWNMALFGGSHTYGIQTSAFAYPSFHPEAALPGFNARLSWKGIYPVRFERFLMKSAMMDNAAPVASSRKATGNVLAEDVAVETESTLSADFGAEISEPEARLDQLEPRSDFRPNIFFALAECESDGDGYTAGFNFRAPSYFGQFKLRSFAYSQNLYAGTYQTYVMASKPIMLYPQLPRFLRENDSLKLNCRYLISSQEFENTDGTRLQSLVKITAEDLSGSSMVLADLPQTTAVQDLQGHLQTSLRIPENCRKLGVEYRIAVLDPSGKTIATDAVCDSVPVLQNHITITEFLPFSIRQGEKKTLKSAFVLPPDSLRFSFTANPYRIVSEQLQDMEFDSCKTALSAAWKMAGYYMCGKDWPSVWPLLQRFAKKNSGFSWIRESEASYFITMQVMSALSMIPQKELMRLDHMRSAVQNALKFLNEQISEDFERDTARHINTLSDDKVNLLYILSCWKPYSDVLFHNPAIAYYTDLAKQCANKTSLQNQALLLRYFLATNNMNEAERILANLNRLALYDKEWGMYWKRENLGGSTGQRIRCMSDLACAYMEFSYAMESENPKRSDSLASQYREILNWLLNMRQTVDFRSGNGSSISTADLVRQAAAFAPQKISAQVAEKRLSEQTYRHGDVCVQIGKLKFESDLGMTSLGLASQEAQAFKNKTTVEWSGSDHHQVGYGSIKAFSKQEMNSIKPQQDKGVLSIERTYRDLYDTSAEVQSSQGDLHFETGKRIRVCVEIQAERDFSYIRLRSLRPAGLEWVSTQSGYGFENGLSYYKDVDDTGVDFFIEFLPKGRYLLYYELKADTEGIFTDGPATIESDFNENFGAHSSSSRIILGAI